MPYEVAMSGGAPWGFRLSEGSFSGASCMISRITPGGKAAQANVMQGDVLVAVNGVELGDLNLHDIMILVKDTGEQVHLTLLTQEDIEGRIKQKRQSEVNFTTATEAERPASNIPPTSPRGHTPSVLVSPIPAEDGLQEGVEVGLNRGHPVSPLVTSPNVPRNDSRSAMQQPTPKPRTTLTPCSGTPIEVTDSDAEQTQENPKKECPDYVKRKLKPQKARPEFKPEVNWLHGKLKINLKANPNVMSDPGNRLKAAAQAHPNQPIEIEGPLSATVIHAQYNTPVALYSGTQIVNALAGTVAAKGSKMTHTDMLSDSMVDVNKDTPVYKFVHRKESVSPAPAQSRSMQILDALLAQPEANLASAF